MAAAIKFRHREIGLPPGAGDSSHTGIYAAPRADMRSIRFSSVRRAAPRRTSLLRKASSSPEVDQKLPLIAASPSRQVSPEGLLQLSSGVR